MCINRERWMDIETGLMLGLPFGKSVLVSVWENILTDFQFELPGSNFKELVVDEKLCKRPYDTLCKLIERSPFVDYIEFFKKNFGISISFSKKGEKYITDYAESKNIQVSDAIKTLTKGIEALSYMNYEDEFEITDKILVNPKYFDTLYVDWHEENIEE